MEMKENKKKGWVKDKKGFHIKKKVSKRILMQ